MDSRLRFPFVAFLAASALTAAASAQVICSQSVDNFTIGGGGVACVTQTNQYNAGNTFLRRYSFPSSCTIPANNSISAVHFGVQLATAGPAGNGEQPGIVRLFSIAPTAPLTFANMTPLYDQNIMIADTAGLARVEIVTLNNQVAVPAGQDIVAAIEVPDGVADMHVYFPGSNDLGQNAPSYIASVGCGLGEPTDYNNVGSGFPNVHLIIDLEFSPPPASLGTNYCLANPNSTGVAGTISASGSNVATANNLSLTASNLPPGQFGIFVTSLTQDFVPNVGSGNLCVGGQIGRFRQANQILQVNAAGQFTLAIDTSAVPQGAAEVPILAGQTRNFQAWHRDVTTTPPIVLTSNLTNAVAITFQ